MSRLDPEQSGLPKRGPDTAETSFFMRSTDALKIGLANETIKKDYPQCGENGKFLTLRVKRAKFLLLVQRVARPVSSWIMEQKVEKIEEVDKTIQEDTRVENNENEEPSVRERAREKNTENTRRKTQLEKRERTACGEATPSGADKRDL